MTHRLLSHPLHMVLGFSLWLVWFGVVYGGLAVACAVHAPEASRGPMTWINGGFLLFTLAVAALLAALAWTTGRAAARMPPGQAARDRFVAITATALNAAAAGSTVVVGLPLALLPPCL